MRDEDLQEGLRLARMVRERADIGHADLGRCGSMNACQEFNYKRAVEALLAHARIHYAHALSALAEARSVAKP